MESNKRAMKTSRTQYEMYLNELEENSSFRENKFDIKNTDILKDTWQKLVERLNSCGGAIRDEAGWKRVFTDWKSQTRGKARKIKYAYIQTGNVNTPKNLTDLEEKLLDLTGRVVVEGMKHVKEFGLDEKKLASEVTSEIENQPDETGPSTSRASSILPPPQKKKKRTSLTACLEKIVQPDPDKNNILCEINNNLRALTKIEAKKLKLKRLVLTLQYPEYDFVLSASDSE